MNWLSMSKIEAKIIADSINKQGNRITSFLLTMPRSVLSEFNTHRAFSRNSASSRAIPFQKMLDGVSKNPFIPKAWQQDHTGMQGIKYIDEQYVPTKVSQWLSARDEVVSWASILNRPLKTDPAGIDTDTELIEGTTVSKQICNRLLEPFAWHTVLVTSTEYENFFSLRANEEAEIHIDELAQKMLAVYNLSNPKLLSEGEWHLPYGDEVDEEKLSKILFGVYRNFWPKEQVTLVNEAKIKIAIARCARTSYTTIDTQLKHDYEKDISLYDKLGGSGHASPFEHAAKAMSDYEYDKYTHTYLDFEGSVVVEKGWCGNFRGYVQHRKMLKNENRKDSRVINKKN